MTVGRVVFRGLQPFPTSTYIVSISWGETCCSFWGIAINHVDRIYQVSTSYRINMMGGRVVFVFFATRLHIDLPCMYECDGGGGLVWGGVCGSAPFMPTFCACHWGEPSPNFFFFFSTLSAMSIYHILRIYFVQYSTCIPGTKSIFPLHKISGSAVIFSQPSPR